MRNLLSLFFLFGTIVFSHCQEKISFISEFHDYKIDSEIDYQTKTIIEAVNNTDVNQTFGFPIGELSEIESIIIEEWTGKSWKSSAIKKSVTISTLNFDSFFSGTKRYYYIIPPHVRFRFEIQTKEKNTILLSKIYKKGYYDAESTAYRFEIPEALHLSTSSTVAGNGIIEIDSSLFDETLMALIIHPIGQEKAMYFSQWFKERMMPQLTISKENIPQELIEIEKLHDKKKLAEACFEYVQRRIKYIDIENGINAVIPRKSESVLKNGLGDCKDMATLLTAIYRYFGLDAYQAISRTINKKEKFDFPSVAMANHMICALFLQNEWYFLDATEDACLFGDPSMQILGTEVFLVDHPTIYFLDVPNTCRSKSTVQFDYDFDFESNTLRLKLESKGKSNLLMYHAFLNKNKPEEFLGLIFRTTSVLKWKIDSTSYTNSESYIYASTQISPSFFSQLKDKKMINLSFLPNPEAVSLIFENNDYPIFDANVDFVINFNGAIQNQFKIEENKDLFVFVSDTKLKISCFLNKEHQSNYLNSFYPLTWKKLMEKPITIIYAN